MASQAAELSSITADTISLVGPEATPAATKDLLARCRFAHLVAHGAALGSSPAFHCLFLEDPDGSDSRLYAHEVLATDLRSLDLVTLCACETALGRSDPAGNIRGLPTTLAAGRRRGSRPHSGRSLPMPHSIYFFGRLHTELAKHDDRLLAFRAAQLAAREVLPDPVRLGSIRVRGTWR